MASWLLIHKHEWTHLCDPLLITKPSVFPAILHSVPTSLCPSDPSFIQEICEENNIGKKDISNIRWLGNPIENKKSHGSIVINFLEKSLILQVEKGGLFHKCLFFKGAHYIKAPTQCFNCYEIGHTANYCKNKPLCQTCGDDHNTKDCTQFPTDEVRCFKCINNLKNISSTDEINNFDIDDLRYRHSPTGNLCPLCNKSSKYNKNPSNNP